MTDLLKLNRDELINLKKDLQSQLSIVDRGIEDILHVIEYFNIEDLTIEDLENLKKLREKRRRIKNGIQQATSLLRSKPENRKDNLKNMIERQKNPTYHVKVLTNLYGEKLG